MSAVWTTRLAASADPGVFRTDLLVGALLYAGAAAILAPVGAFVGAVAASVVVALYPPAAAIGGAIVTGCLLAPVIGLFGWWLADVARGQVVYELSADAAGLRVVTFVPAMWSWLPDRWLAAVGVPDPWPAALSGSTRDFRAPWDLIRGARVEPHALLLDLSADRTLSLALRGADLDAASTLAQRLSEPGADPVP